MYCIDLQNGKVFNEDYLINTVAIRIAPFWDNVGSQLGVNNLNNIQHIDDPTQYKFDRMLKRWVGQQTCTKDEVYAKIHDALEGIQLVRAAEEFYHNVYNIN